jgi:hypothetical protein
MQTLKQCTWILFQSHKDDKLMMEMSGRVFAKLTCYVNANRQESELEPAKGLK